jgi:glycosyltransferase involved in cell wall biosynthesis
MKPSVCLLPNFAPGATGGVARHVHALRTNLRARGWEVLDRPAPGALLHVHAAELGPVAADVYTNHGIHPVQPEMPDWQRQQDQNILYNLRTAREIIAVSHWTANQWQKQLGRQPHIIPNGVDLAEWQAVPRGTWRQALGAAARQPIVLWGKTQVNDLCDPTPALELALRHPDLLFVLTVAQKALLFPPRNVRLVGPQPFESLQRLLADCDVYLATTLENHSLQVLEAMALAKPVLGYDWGGTGETLCGGVDGVLVPPGDYDRLDAGLHYALAQRDALGAAARQTIAERYQWGQVVDQLLKVYALARDGRTAAATPLHPKCSIVIPCFNKAPYVAEAIQSALAQVGAPPYELIVVDDGSTDGSLAAIRQALAEGPGDSAQSAGPACHVIAQENAGVAAARNRGIRLAQGEYIACLDADDRIDPRFLGRLSAALDSDPGLGIAYSDFNVFGDNWAQGPFQWTVRCDEFDFAKLVKGNLLPCCNLFRKRAWGAAGGYQDINPSWEDYELWLAITKRGWGARRVPGPLFWYRKVAGQGRDHASHGQEARLRALVNRRHRDLYPPLVSVIIPCYRQSQFLRAAIQSVCTQTFPDWEVVVVDDGNGAGGEPAGRAEAAAIRQIVDECASADVRLVVNPTNLGLAGARNAGIRAAHGEWLVPLDADDRLADTFLDAALQAAALDPGRFVYGDTVWWWPADPASGAPGRLELHPAEDYDPATLLRHISWMCSILVHKSAWQATGGYQWAMSQAGGFEDWEFCLSLAEHGVQGVHLAKPALYYRQHAADQMRRTAETQHARLRETMRRLHPATFREGLPHAS